MKRVRRQTKDQHQGTPDIYPTLRAGIDPFPARDKEGHAFVGLHDQLNLGTTQVLLPQDLYYVLQFFDGKHSTFDLRMEYMRRFGTFLFVDRLAELLDVLDRNYFLNNAAYAARLQQLTKAYRVLPARAPACAGSSYPGDREELRRYLEDLADKARLPDEIIIQYKNRPILAMAIPHIDVRLGGSAYAAAYSLLRRDAGADLYVILGIGHIGVDNLFVMTTKDFATPLGPVHTRGDLVARINDSAGMDFTRQELVHRHEHSIEFQTIFLKNFIKRKFAILPVLCSFTPADLDQNRTVFERFVNALKAVLQDHGGSVCILASVDLAHVGLKYGDSRAPDIAAMALVERNDRDVIRALSSGDAELFQSLIRFDNNRFHVCGYAALTTLFSVLPPLIGHLLAYDRAVMDENHSTVTFASMAFAMA